MRIIWWFENGINYKQLFHRKKACLALPTHTQTLSPPQMHTKTHELWSFCQSHTQTIERFRISHWLAVCCFTQFMIMISQTFPRFPLLPAVGIYLSHWGAEKLCTHMSDVDRYLSILPVHCLHCNCTLCWSYECSCCASILTRALTLSWQHNNRTLKNSWPYITCTNMHIENIYLSSCN